MTPVGEVSFELERFEWTADDRLEVVGRWNGVRGRRISRPALTVDAGGRRQRVSGTQISNGDPDEPWRASFDWDASRGDIAGAELEIGRSLVVELPPPRRRRRRSAVGAEGDLRAQVEELRGMVAELRAERAAVHAERDRRPRDCAARSRRSGTSWRASWRACAAASSSRPSRPSATGSRPSSKPPAATAGCERSRPSASGSTAALTESERERDRLAAELEAAGGDAASDQELAGLRLALGSLRAAHEALEDELEEMRSVRDERDEFAGQLEQLRAAAEDEEREKTQLGELIRELQERATSAETTRDRLSDELATAREEIDALKHHVAQQEKALDEVGEEAEKRLETERATTTEVHARLAVAREEAQRTMVAEAEETERLREELAQARDEAERLLAAERAEVARLREELLSSEVDEAGEEASRRMLERVTRDLERERATSRNLRRELDDLRSDSAEYRRAVSSSTANGTLAMDEPPAGRPIRTPEGTQRRVEAARAAASARVPKVPPSPGACGRYGSSPRSWSPRSASRS